jgi:stage II sporulation protein D
VQGLARRFRGALTVTVRDGQLLLVNELPLEAYLGGVVGGEQLAGRPEALKAQAVVSRTYALAGLRRHAEAGHQLCDLTHCQLYRGRDDERPEVAAAVEATRGLVLRHRGALEPTAFHAACGGATSAPADVFGEASAQKGVSDVAPGESAPLCGAAPDFTWTRALPRARLAAALGLPAEGPALEVLRRDAGGRVLEVRAFGVHLSGNALQARVGRALGFGVLKSLAVTVAEVDGEVRLSGRGLGHGVGLCQHGARELARRGQDFRHILAHYFPDGVLGDAP